MNVLIVGSGAREHCLAAMVSRSSKAGRIFVAPGNAGTASLAENLDIGFDAASFPLIDDAIRKYGIDLVVVGPEAPLVEGIVDYLSERGHRVFGPSKKASVIEASKHFVKQLCHRYDIPTAPFQAFQRHQGQEAKAYLGSLSQKDFPIVIKADGLASGKGVVIAGTKEESFRTVDEIFVQDQFGSSGDRIVIEEFIDGFEVSILCLCDGKDILALRLAQDYKKIFDGDLGKNTGGMGSYSPVPFVSQKLYRQIWEEIILKTYQGLQSEGIDYRGVLYGGIIVKDTKPYLLEYNCRFGDPETQAVLPGLKDDFLSLLFDAVDGKLAGRSLQWEDKKTVCVVLASKGYPESSSRGDVIGGLDALSEDTLVFHAGTRRAGKDLVTDGGRVLSIVSSAPGFDQAREAVYGEVSRISFDGMQYRKDIALKAVRAGSF